MSGKSDSLGYRDGETNRNTIRFADCGAPQAKGALAVTLVSYDSAQSTIVDGDIVINGIYRFGDLRNDGTSRKVSSRPVYDLTDVLVHELGHWFGLADNREDPTAIMYPYFNPGEVRSLTLGKSDIEALDTLYASSQTPNKHPACSVAAPGAGCRYGAPWFIAFALLWALRRRVSCGPQSP
jgi:hypothetical protein